MTTFQQKITYSIAAILIAVGVFLFGYSLGLTKAVVPAGVCERSEATSNKLATVIIDNGREIKSFKDIDIKSGDNVFSVLQQVAGINNIKLDYNPAESSDWGVFIKQIGDKVNGQGQKYWQYWVNGGQPQVAADKYELQPGDVVWWTFHESSF